MHPNHHFFIIGLGNPGKEYAGTRHNAGFLLVDHLRRFLMENDLLQGGKLQVEQHKFEGLLSTFVSKDAQGHECRFHFFKPLTFMNLSSRAVQPLLSFFKADLQSILVVHDDLDIPRGQLRKKKGGGAGGHNGIVSLIEALGPNFHRLRIGIGRPEGEHHKDVSSFVLAPFSSEEEVTLQKLFEDFAKEFYLLCKRDHAMVMKFLMGSP